MILELGLSTVGAHNVRPPLPEFQMNPHKSRSNILVIASRMIR